MLTLHSDSPLQLTVEDTLQSDLEFRSNELIIQSFG